MKKILILMLAITVCCATLFGCESQKDDDNSDAPVDSEVSKEDQDRDNSNAPVDSEVSKTEDQDRDNSDAPVNSEASKTEDQDNENSDSPVNSEVSKTEDQDNENSDAPINSEVSEEDTSNIIIETPLDDYVFSFSSYEDINSALTKVSSDKYLDLRTSQQSYGNVYKQTLAAYETNKIKMLVPTFNGEFMELRNKEEFPNISFMTCELYNLPWIWYHCSLDGYDLSVRVSNISIIDHKELRAAGSYRNVLSLIAPEAPSPSNFKDYKSYSSIYEKEIVLSGGQTIKAMISELKESSNIYVMIYKDGTLISLYADAEVFSDSFWESFDIAPY